MANNTANITAVITAEDKASAVIKNFGGEVDKTATTATGSLDKLNTSFIAVTAATAGLVAFGKKSLDAFNQQDLAVTRLKAGIQNVTSATDKNVDSLIKQANALQKTTRFSDEQYISAQGILTTFQLNQKAIAALTPRLADMSEGLARVTGEMPDLEGNAILVAKAIGGEDVTGLVGALRRVGVLMTDSQQKMLQTGTVEERVALVTKILDQNFKGLAASAGGTTAGKMTELKNQFNELEESAGGVIAKGLTPLLNLLNQHPAILATVTIAITALTAAFIALKVAAAIGTVMSAAGTAIAFVGTAATGTTVAFGGMLTVLASPVVLAIAGAVADLALLYKAITSVTGAFNAMNNSANASVAAAKTAEDTANRIQDAANRGKTSLVDLYNTQQKLGVPQTVYKSANTGGVYLSGFASGGYTGMGSPNDVAGIVHKGEFVLPQDAVDQGTGKPKWNGGGSVNITIQAGAFMGSDVEARKFAQLVVKHYNDAMGSKMQAGMA